jgi:hypothetical protein
MTKTYLASIGVKHWEIVADSEEEVLEILIGTVDTSKFPIPVEITEMVIGGSNEQ